jgi:hypothetical protein
MIPAPESTPRIWLCLSSLGAAAVLTAACSAGEDRAAGPAATKSDTTTAKTAEPKNKSTAQTDTLASEKEPRAKASAEPKARLALAAKSGALARAENTATPETPIARAVRIVAECQDQYKSVTDYTCTFWKRERIAGTLIPVHIMAMKVRTKPQSIYLRFQQPAKGREAIFVAGRHGGKVVAHDVGFNKLLAGTLHLEPTSSRAMAECRHPITEAGIGPLLETVSKRWALELNQTESVVAFDDMKVGEQHCLMIETTHPDRGAEFLFHKVRLYIDKDLRLPIRFEAYDWPKSPGAEPELAEEYTYSELKLNVGLKDVDFDVANSSYSFGRF